MSKSPKSAAQPAAQDDAAVKLAAEQAAAEQAAAEQAAAEQAATIKMRRSAEDFPAPHEADVHPDEVPNYQVGGWSVVESEEV